MLLGKLNTGPNRSSYWQRISVLNSHIPGESQVRVTKGAPLKLLRPLANLTLSIGILIAPTIPIFSQDALNTAGKSAYDHGLRHFYWLYTFDPAGHQRRDWYQESSSAWNEIYEDGRYNHSLIIDAHAVVDGNRGIIAKAETSTLLLFIPDRDANGSNPQWLRFLKQGESSWTLFAMKFEVEQPAKDDLARLDAEEKQMQAQQRQMQERERLAEQAAHSANLESTFLNRR